MEFAGRTAVVTGGSSGIGRALTEALRSAGARVASWDVDPDADIACDVSDPDSVSAGLDETMARYGAPSILVAAAGIMLGRPILATDPAEWRRVIDVNLTGVFLTIRAVAGAMVEAKNGGSVVAVSSVNGVIADPVVGAYSASKAGVIHLIKVAALELAPHDIRVNAILPGPTETNMLVPFLDEAYRTAIAETTPLGRTGAADDISNATMNLIRSDWVTGQALAADGGASLMTARGNSEHRKQRLQT